MGYRITIDQANCINCGICMDVCPVQALDMTRPTRRRRDHGRRPAPAALDDGVPRPGRRVRRLFDLRPRVPGGRGAPDHGSRADTARPARDRAQVEAPAPGWMPLSAVTREVHQAAHPSPFAPWYAWQTAGHPAPGRGWDGSDVGPCPDAPCQAACPAGTDAGRYVGLIAEGRYDDAYAVAAEVNPFPLGVRLDLHGPVRVCLPARRARRADRDPQAQAIRGRARHAAADRQPAQAATHGARRDRRRRSGRHVGRVLPRPARLPGDGLRGDARAGRHDGDRDPRLPPAARGAPGGDRPHPRSGRGAAARRVMGRDFTLADLEREGYHAVFLATGAPRAGRWTCPATTSRASCRPRASSRRSTSASAALTGRSWWSAVAARRWTPPARRCGPARSLGDGPLPARPRRDARPARRGRGGRARRHRASVGSAPERGHWRRRASRASVRRQRPTGTRDGRPSWAPDRRPQVELVPAATVLVAIGEEPDPSILPARRRDRDRAPAGIVADPGTLATGRAGVFAGGDVVSGPKTIIDAVAAGRRRPAPSTSTWPGCADGEAEILAAVRYRTPTDPPA